jgi:hypothetical protein
VVITDNKIGQLLLLAILSASRQFSSRNWRCGRKIAILTIDSPLS